MARTRDCRSEPFWSGYTLRVPSTAKLRLALLATAIVLVACGHGDEIPYLGRWHGEYIVDKILEGGSAKNKQRESLHGSLQVYATDKRLKLHMEGEQEAIDADGEWSRKGTEMTLHFTKVNIDDNGGIEHRDPNLKFIPAPDIMTAYGHSLILHLSKDKQKLNGLEVSIGQLVGHYLFTRSTD